MGVVNTIGNARVAISDELDAAPFDETTQWAGPRERPYGAAFSTHARYRLAVPLLVARTVTGECRHLYRGELLPANIDPAQLCHLLEDGLVAVIEET